ncbi:MAG: adenosyl-hopene transferase HpnH [Thermoguttaceae bacterium]
MKFPFSLTYKMASYLLRQSLFGTKYFPLVLMLEPLHACNLRCTGCGRIREYSDTLHKQMSVSECLDSIDQCSAPIVSICGGEPLIYPEIIELVDQTLKRNKHIYLCTNGVLLENKLDEFVQLSKKNKRTKTQLFWNVHLDGIAKIHDEITGKPGTYEKTFRGIVAAKKAGFFVYTNTTLYKNTKLNDLVELAENLEQVGIDGMMIAPGYGYEAVKKERMEQESQSDSPRLSPSSTISENLADSDSFFWSREDTHKLFCDIRTQLKRFRLTTTPLYLDFLCGERTFPCAAWANPTRNIKGWKGPCYLITDQHYKTFRELIKNTDWTKIGYGNDPRCEHCQMHCGYEPAAVLFGKTLKDRIRLAIWQFS